MHIHILKNAQGWQGGFRRQSIKRCIAFIHGPRLVIKNITLRVAKILERTAKIEIVLRNDTNGKGKQSLDFAYLIQLRLFGASAFRRARMQPLYENLPITANVIPSVVHQRAAARVGARLPDNVFAATTGMFNVVAFGTAALMGLVFLHNNPVAAELCLGIVDACAAL